MSEPLRSGGAGVEASGTAPRGDRAGLERRQRRQLLLITGAAVAIYVTMRLLPTGTNLNHGDFTVQGGNSIEMCDPANPQFIPVVAVRSPVSLAAAMRAPLVAGTPAEGTLTLGTSSDKSIGPEDLLVVHDHPLHLMIADPTLTDYQHVHPAPGRKRGEWTFAFTPRFGGTYRLFADFTPVATGRGLYATTDLPVAGPVAPPNPAADTAARGTFVPVHQGGYWFEMSAGGARPQVRQPIDLTLRIRADGGGAVPLEPIMGAYAHVVAFDARRSGFAHLHPAQPDPLARPDPVHPALAFRLTIPAAGRYVIWAQVNLAGHEAFAPFWFDVTDL